MTLSFLRCKIIDKIIHFRQTMKLSSYVINNTTARLERNHESATIYRYLGTDICKPQKDINIKRFKGLTQFYNPAIVRAFEKFQIQDTSNTKLLEIHRCATNMLISLDSDMLRYRENMNKNDNRAIAGRKFSYKVETARRTAGELSSTVLGDIKSDKELIALSSFMAILMPKSEGVWFNFDKNLSFRLDEFSMESLVLSAHAIMATKTNLRLNNIFCTPNLVADRIFSTTKLSLLHDNMVENLPSNDIPPISTSSLQCVSSKSFEQIALYLQILSVKKPEDSYKYGSKLNPNPDRKNLEKVAEEFIDFLSTNKEPIQFLTLRGIWVSASLLDLPNSYQLYKALYDQIYRSITVEPMQIIDQEDAIYSLFESMKLAKFKNGKLVKEICHLLDIHGFDLENYGIHVYMFIRIYVYIHIYMYIYIYTNI
jgi:hypothetical protein